MKRDWTCDGCGCLVNRGGNVEVQALRVERDQLRTEVERLRTEVGRQHVSATSARVADSLADRAAAWLRDYDNAETEEHLAALLRAVRDEAIEECARECERDAAEWAAVLDPSQSSLAEIGTAMNCARRIRALKGGG